MNYRLLGKTGFKVSEIGLGTWQVGGKWGSPFDAQLADRILDTAIEGGINFIDTADVYSDGLSEEAVGRALQRHKHRIFVATKCGRQITPHTSEGYQPPVLRSFVEDSLKRLKLETLDLVQLHCPPYEVYYRPEIFELFDRLKEEGKIRNLGVSVQKVEEAMKSLEYENVTSVQIIFNLFRQRPAEQFFQQAVKRKVGIIVRVPLASGLLSGLYDQQTKFDEGDHRFFNREGAKFDKGETFSGIPYQTGLEAVDELRNVLPGKNLVHSALRWILDFPEVTTVIPGASRTQQVQENLLCLSMKELTASEKEAIDQIYEKRIKTFVHQKW